MASDGAVGAFLADAGVFTPLRVCAAVSNALRVYEDVLMAHHAPVPPDVTAMRVLFHEAAMADARRRATSAPSLKVVPRAEVASLSSEAISTADAADMLGISTRRIRQLCQDGALTSSRGERGVLLVDRASVVAHKDRKHMT